MDVIVIGGGHAGCEAAAAAVRVGARVAMVTMDRASVGAMSCNPAIGGVGKGHIVREIDVFEGLIAAAADDAAIHYRMLNRSKGPAVHGPRVQADRAEFRRSIWQRLTALQALQIIQGEAEALLIDGAAIAGVRLGGGDELQAPTVILAAGTFLGGRLFWGGNRASGGRWSERSADALGVQLGELGLPLGRMKTGTPPRLDGRTIDWSSLDLQRSDTSQWTMSSTGRRKRPQLFCALARTNVQTHRAIREGLIDSPLASGDIVGRGPRYCPSIEDKVTRFSERDSHQIFLEPEGSGSPLVYPNGISTSLPLATQLTMLRTIAGLARVDAVTPGYAVEYTHVDPRVLDHRLAVRGLEGLFLAGQINGTTGYEEAAGQGLVAGLNAAAAALHRQPTVLARENSYIGVMIDDLVLQGVTEPYRMLTARAENRLHLRADNAESRLAPLAEAAGCLGTSRLELVAENALARERVAGLLSGLRPEERLNVDTALDACKPLVRERREIVEETMADLLYAPYVERSRREQATTTRAARSIARNFDYGCVRGLSAEMRERLEAARPDNTDEARRIAGISPAAINALWLAHAGGAA